MKNIRFMYSRKLLLLLIFSVFFSAYSNESEPFRLKVKQHTLYLDGYIAQGSYSQVAEALRDEKIDRISISSSGGSVTDAIQIALAVYNINADVEVREQCVSSCANYIFPAGRKKYLHTYSMVVWHGGANSPLQFFSFTSNGKILTLPEKKQMLSQNREWQNIRKAERDFYHTIGVSPTLPFCGQTLKGYSISSNIFDSVYSYSGEALSAFGVRNILFTDGSEADWEKNTAGNGVKVIKKCSSP